MSETQLIVLLYLLVGWRFLLYAAPKLFPQDWLAWLKELVDAIVVAGITAVLLLNFVVRSFYIPSGSMEPTLVSHDFILVNELIYRFVAPHRGDIVVFQPPPRSNAGEQDFIKRVVGIEGDVIEVRDGALYRNGYRVNEPFIKEPIDRPFGPILVQQGHLFVMGDHRNSSYDSRFWGQVPVDNLVGQAFMIFVNKKSPGFFKFRWLPSDQGTTAVSTVDL